MFSCREGKGWRLAVWSCLLRSKESKSDINIRFCLCRKSWTKCWQQLDEGCRFIVLHSRGPDLKVDLVPLLLSQFFIFWVDSCCDCTPVDGVVPLQQSGNKCHSAWLLIKREFFIFYSNLSLKKSICHICIRFKIKNHSVLLLPLFHI